MRQLYPEIQPFATGRLRVSDVHELHYEQCGNPAGKPVVVVHGGPGGGCADYYRQFFDPEAYRIVLFDQRGAGKSTPHACLEENTTWHLVADMEKLREHLSIEKWMVFGGSWGSTLSLSYAETHPERCTALVLRGIFMLRRKELLWFYQEGASFIFPDFWEEFVAPIPEVERGDLISAYHRRLSDLNNKNPEEQLACARAWSKWETATSRLYVDPEYIAATDSDEFCLAFARIESHYFVNAGFFKTETQLLDNAEKIRHIPTTIVQGRYDVVCPAYSAWDLHRRLPEATFIMVPDAGHSMKEQGILHHLVEATDRYKDL